MHWRAGRENKKNPRQMSATRRLSLLPTKLKQASTSSVDHVDPRSAGSSSRTQAVTTSGRHWTTQNRVLLCCLQAQLWSLRHSRGHSGMRGCLRRLRQSTVASVSAMSILHAKRICTVLDAASKIVPASICCIFARDKGVVNRQCQLVARLIHEKTCKY